MACFPKIDQACPLDSDAQRGVGSWCGRCGTTVHALDAMDDAARATFLREASGPVCVSYRLRASRVALGLGAALLVSSALPAHADDAQQAVAAPQVQTGTRIKTSDKNAEALEPIVVMGAVKDPRGATLVDVDDRDVPDLPVVHESGKGKR